MTQTPVRLICAPDASPSRGAKRSLLMLPALIGICSANHAVNSRTSIYPAPSLFDVPFPWFPTSSPVHAALIAIHSRHFHLPHLRSPLRHKTYHFRNSSTTLSRQDLTCHQPSLSTPGCNPFSVMHDMNLQLHTYDACPQVLTSIAIVNTRSAYWRRMSYPPVLCPSCKPPPVHTHKF